MWPQPHRIAPNTAQSSPPPSGGEQNSAQDWSIPPWSWPNPDVCRTRSELGHLPAEAYELEALGASVLGLLDLRMSSQHGSDPDRVWRECFGVQVYMAPALASAEYGEPEAVLSSQGTEIRVGPSSRHRSSASSRSGTSQRSGMLSSKALPSGESSGRVVRTAMRSDGHVYAKSGRRGTPSRIHPRLGRVCAPSRAGRAEVPEPRLGDLVTCVFGESSAGRLVEEDVQKSGAGVMVGQCWASSRPV